MADFTKLRVFVYFYVCFLMLILGYVRNSKECRAKLERDYCGVNYILIN